MNYQPMSSIATDENTGNKPSGVVFGMNADGTKTFR